MQLEQTLAVLRDKFAKIIPDGASAIMEGHIESLRKNGAIDQILKPGTKAPAFTLKNQRGEDISFVDLIKHGPLVVSSRAVAGALFVRQRYALLTKCMTSFGRLA